MLRNFLTFESRPCLKKGHGGGTGFAQDSCDALRPWKALLCIFCGAPCFFRPLCLFFRPLWLCMSVFRPPARARPRHCFSGPPAFCFSSSPSQLALWSPDVVFLTPHAVFLAPALLFRPSQVGFRTSRVAFAGGGGGGSPPPTHPPTPSRASLLQSR